MLDIAREQSPIEEILEELTPEEIASALTEDEQLALQYEWELWARPKQRPPRAWRWGWLLKPGRGFGKTRTGAETVIEAVTKGLPIYDAAGNVVDRMKPVRRLGLIAPTAADVRDTMVEGESGILAYSAPWYWPHYEPSKRKLTWPNGAIAKTYSADEPERLRGPQHEFLWLDELCAYERAQDLWDMAMFGLRLARQPMWLVTTTPKPIPLIRALSKDPDVVVTDGSTYENAGNLAPKFLEKITDTYKGTRLGRQELYGEILDDVPGALWQRARIDELRRAKAPDLARIVVAIDPAVTSMDGSDETGILVAGKGVDGHAYVLGDRSCRLSPDGWARRAVIAYHEFRADRILAEVNNGGDLVEMTIRSVASSVPEGIREDVAYKSVRASRGKMVRAEPIAALYEQGRVHHVGSFPELEDQMCAYVPEGWDKSPDRADALVWALTELMLEPEVWIV